MLTKSYQRSASHSEPAKGKMVSGENIIHMQHHFIFSSVPGILCMGLNNFDQYDLWGLGDRRALQKYPLNFYYWSYFSVKIRALYLSPFCGTCFPRRCSFQRFIGRNFSTLEPTATFRCISHHFQLNCQFHAHFNYHYHFQFIHNLY